MYVNQPGSQASQPYPPTSQPQTPTPNPGPPNPRTSSAKFSREPKNATDAAAATCGSTRPVATRSSTPEPPASSMVGAARRLLLRALGARAAACRPAVRVWWDRAVGSMD